MAERPMNRGIDTEAWECHAFAVTKPSPLYRMIEHRLDSTLAEFVAARLQAKASWLTMAAEITETTQIEVSDETLRRWFADRVQVTVTIAPATVGAATS